MSKSAIRVLAFLFLLGLAVTVTWWLPQLLSFAGTYSSTIQGLSNLIQIVLWILAALVGLFGFQQMRKRKNKKGSIKVTKGKVTFGGDTNYTNIITDHGNVVSGENVIEGDVIGGDKFTINGDIVTSDKIFVQNPLPLKPGSAPPVPDLFIGRDEELQNLKDRLDFTSRGDMPNLIAVRGWPGVGKTTMAAALAHDRDIAKAFTDGVLWASLGQNPNLLSEMAAWGRALGTDNLLRAFTLKEATVQLTSLLRNKKMLLIVDDVWEVEHAAPFQQVCSKDCTLLITTREPSIAEAFLPPDTVYNLPILTEENAVILLEKLAPTVVAKYPNETRELVRALECLPLALRVAGHMLSAEVKLGWVLCPS